jgi:hypothetical protein
VGNESQRAQTKPAARVNLGLQFSFAEEYAFPNRHLAAGPDKRLPSLEIDLAGQEDLHFSGQLLGSRGSRWRLRMDASAPPEQAGGDDARIVEDEEFVTSQQSGEFREEAVFENS